MSSTDGRPRILLVDDDEFILRSLKRMLLRLGYEVVATSSPLNALDTVLTQPQRFVALITDIEMAELSGPDLVACITASGVALPTLVISSYPDGLPGIAFLRKPFNTPQLVAALAGIGVGDASATAVAYSTPAARGSSMP